MSITVCYLLLRSPPNQTPSWSTDHADAKSLTISSSCSNDCTQGLPIPIANLDMFAGRWDPIFRAATNAEVDFADVTRCHDGWDPPEPEMTYYNSIAFTSHITITDSHDRFPSQKIDFVTAVIISVPRCLPSVVCRCVNNKILKLHLCRVLPSTPFSND